jgi:hypothetical protein
MSKYNQLISKINKHFSVAKTKSPKQLSKKLHKYLFLTLNTLQFSPDLTDIIRNAHERNIDEYFQSHPLTNQCLNELEDWMNNNIYRLEIILKLEKPLKGNTSWIKFISLFCDYLSNEPTEIQ